MARLSEAWLGSAQHGRATQSVAPHRTETGQGQGQRRSPGTGLVHSPTPCPARQSRRMPLCVVGTKQAKPGGDTRGSSVTRINRVAGVDAWGVPPLWVGPGRFALLLEESCRGVGLVVGAVPEFLALGGREPVGWKLGPFVSLESVSWRRSLSRLRCSFAESISTPCVQPNHRRASSSSPREDSPRPRIVLCKLVS